MPSVRVPVPERNAIRFRFSGVESDKSPLRCAVPNIVSYSDLAYPIAPYTHFLVPTGICGRFNVPNRIIAHRMVSAHARSSEPLHACATDV